MGDTEEKTKKQRLSLNVAPVVHERFYDRAKKTQARNQQPEEYSAQAFITILLNEHDEKHPEDAK
jgi:hypothetical protein